MMKDNSKNSQKLAFGDINVNGCVAVPHVSLKLNTYERTRSKKSEKSFIILKLLLTFAPWEGRSLRLGRIITISWKPSLRRKARRSTTSSRCWKKKTGYLWSSSDISRSTETSMNCEWSMKVISIGCSLSSTTIVSWCYSMDFRRRHKRHQSLKLKRH